MAPLCLPPSFIKYQKPSVLTSSKPCISSRCERVSSPSSPLLSEEAASGKDDTGQSEEEGRQNQSCRSS